ncbi:MAG: hypothetical protein RSA29_14415 [Clostridium sp.]|uniref:hypothetical protein n=1 Tax=Clostridium sp. TaxID=1506 RepID=UPI00321787BD
MLYNNFEEATIEIESSIIDKIDFVKLINDCIKMGFNKCIIHIESEKQMKQMNEYLLKYSSEIELYVYQDKMLSEQENKEIFYMSEQLKDQPRKNELFIYKLDFKKNKSIEDMLDFFKKNEEILEVYEYIIIKTFFTKETLINMKQFNDVLERIPKSIKVYYESSMMPTQVCIEHPCNIYLCAGEKCHTVKNKHPGELYIDESGEIIPYGIKNKELTIGNILDESLAVNLEKYNKSPAHNKFIENCKYIRCEYLTNWPFSFFPFGGIINVISE